MATSWKVRQYQDGDESGIVDLMNVEPQEKPYTLERWRWRYESNPYGFITTVAEAKGQIVGHMGLFFLPIRIGRHVLMGAQASELAVHPNFRRQGMFLAIGKQMVRAAKEQNVRLIYGFPNEPAYRGHIQYGWFDVAKVPVLGIFLDSYESTKQRTRKIPAHFLLRKLGRLVDRMYQYKRKKLKIAEIAVEKTSFFDTRFEAFWDDLTIKNANIRVERSSKYLNWRYRQRRDAHYDIFSAVENDYPKGFVVTAIEESQKRRIGYITDIFAHSKPIFHKLLVSSIAFLETQLVDSVKCLMVPELEEYKLLKEAGFTAFQYSPLRMCARPSDESLLDQVNLRQGWYVSYGDCDFV